MLLCHIFFQVVVFLIFTFWKKALCWPPPPLILLIYDTPTPLPPLICRCVSWDKYWPPSMIQVLHRAVYYTHLPVNLCHWPRTDPPLQSGAESQGVYLVWSRYTYHQQPVVAYKHIVTKTLINITMLYYLPICWLI